MVLLVACCWCVQHVEVTISFAVTLGPRWILLYSVQFDLLWISVKEAESFNIVSQTSHTSPTSNIHKTPTLSGRKIQLTPTLMSRKIFPNRSFASSLDPPAPLSRSDESSAKDQVWFNEKNISTISFQKGSAKHSFQHHLQLFSQRID